MKKVIFILLIIQSSILIANAQYLIDFKVNDDTTTQEQYYPVISVNQRGNFIISWLDRRDFPSGSYFCEIFCQKFNSNGIKISNNKRLTDTIYSYYFCPTAYRNDGSFALVYIKNYYRLRIFDSSCNPISPIITINDTINFGSYFDHSSIGTDTNNFIYVVMDYKKYDVNSKPNVYFQKFDASGNKIGTNQRVNDDTNSIAFHTQPVITVRRDKSFIIAWREQTYGELGNIFMQMYNSNGQKIGSNIQVDDTVTGDVDRDLPTISSDSSGNFTIVWEDSRLTSVYYQPWAQNFDYNCNKIGSNYRVDQGFSLDKFHPKVAKRNDGNFVFAWIDSYSGTTMPLCRRYNYSYQSIGNQFPIPRQSLNSSKSIFDIKLFGDKIISAWADYRDTNINIYANILSFQNPDSIISNFISLGGNIPNYFSLFQNYPNPFNPRTKIKFSIPNRFPIGTFPDKSISGTNDRVVVLKVYDIIGKEIQSLVNEQLQPGSYEVTFDGTNLPSGIYFYRLSAGSFSETKN